MASASPVEAPTSTGHKKLHPALRAFLPNEVVSPNVLRIIIAIQVGAFLLLWIRSPFEVLPRPDEVWNAFQELWWKKGLGPELINSFMTNVKALGISLVISLGLAYLTVFPFFRPLVTALSKGRFLGLVGISFAFAIVIGGGQTLKVSLMVFGMVVFFVTSMAAVVAEIPKEAFDHARTLRMNEWQVVWEVVILGTFDKALEVLRQNAAIGWMMLTMVEGNQRSLGGVGAMMLNEQKYLQLDSVFAIILCILVLGLFQDYILGLLRRLVCPYAHITLERK